MIATYILRVSIAASSEKSLRFSLHAVSHFSLLTVAKQPRMRDSGG
jgi:hypothetical protein